MSKEEIMMKILTATPETIGRVAEVLNGKTTETTPGDRRLLTLTEAAHELNVSRMTIHRMCADGRLATIQTRAGRRRIASAALTAFLTGKEVSA
jgi:excisionase family DNA binding protein